MNFRDLLKLIEDDGWKQVRQKGSHRQFRHPIKPGTVTIAFHSLSDDIPIGTMNNILKQSGLKR
jgi:predicted RNA binding protein YcfA (HicA-like mRNA interferase family)